MCLQLMSHRGGLDWTTGPVRGGEAKDLIDGLDDTVLFSRLVDLRNVVYYYVHTAL